MRRLVAAIALLTADGCREEAVVLDVDGAAAGACALTLVDESEGLEVAVAEQSRWPAGACYELTLTNQSGARLDWSVLVAVTGLLDNTWNTTTTVIDASDGALIEARGLASSNNQRLEPGASATIGFCLAC
ncbi:MAG: hypothetical protein R3B09_20630 [Nannocystaceae bacterium]